MLAAMEAASDGGDSPPSADLEWIFDTGDQEEHGDGSGAEGAIDVASIVWPPSATAVPDDSAAPAKSPKKTARVSPQPKNVAQAGDAQKDAVQKGDAKEGAATSAAPRKPARSKAATPKKTVAKKPKKPAAKPKPKKKT